MTTKDYKIHSVVIVMNQNNIEDVQLSLWSKESSSATIVYIHKATLILYFIKDSITSETKLDLRKGRKN